jgi:general secretion pathway protein F
MTLFRYEAIAASGIAIKGQIEADTLSNALATLNQKNIRPYLAEPDNASEKSFQFKLILGRPRHQWRANFIRKLATLLAAGINLDRSLLLMAKQTARKTEIKIIESIAREVSNGQALSSALTKQNKLFQADEIGLVKASEQTGSLVPVLEELASLMERRLLLKSKLTSALVYPAFLLTLAPVSLIIIATVLVPNLAPLFENSGAEMPFALRAMIWFSKEFNERGLLWLLLSALLAVGIYWSIGLPAVSIFWARISTGLPFIGEIKRKSESARICRTLGSLIKSGAPLQTALLSILDVTGDKTTQSILQHVHEKVTAGAKLGDAMKAITSINSASLQMIAIGEETNKLDTMLLYVAEGEEKSLTSYIDRLMTLLTPLLTIALGLLVGGIVMSIMRAILSVNELVAQ